MSEHVFPGVNTVAGQVGSLIALLDRIACLGECVTHLTGGTVFADKSTEARLETDAAFTALSVVADEIYFGMDVKFTALRLKFGTAGVLGGSTVIVWEYWNGTAWATLTVAGAASNLTADGAVTWTAPGAWATNSVNAGPTMYHVRARVTVANYTTAPTINVGVHNWSVYDGIAGTNAKTYFSPGESGSESIYLWVNDNGPISAQSAGCRIYEAWDSGLHTGTAPAPTVAQLANGVQVRKSVTLDATARTVWASISRDRIVLFALSGDTAGQAIGEYLGDFTSYVAGDAFNRIALGNADEVTMSRLLETVAVSTLTIAGHYVLRAYTGSGGALQVGKLGVWGVTASGSLFAYTNAPDGSLLTLPFILQESGPYIRGELTGLLAVPHINTATLATGDTFTLGGSRYTIIVCRDGGVGGATRFVAARGAA